MNKIKRRLKIIIAYPVLYMLDIAIAVVHGISFEAQRNLTKSEVKRKW